MSKVAIEMGDTRVQIIKGMKVAVVVTGISPRKAVMAAGYNQNQMVRFFSGTNDIMLQTLIDICEKGFKMPFGQIWELGGASK
jgi:hypothetical protein